MNLDLHILSNEALSEKLNATVQAERRLTVEVLHLLREVERRELFAQMGFSSLFSYCVEHLNYSESAAQRRIVAMRAIRDLPELEEKIETGRLSLSVLALAESSLRQNAKRKNQKVDLFERRTVLAAMDGLSRRKTEVFLIEKFELAPLKAESTETPLNNGSVRIVLELTAAEMHEIEELRRLSSQPQTAKELILRMVRAETAKKKRHLGEAPLLRKSTSAGGSNLNRRTQTGGLKSQFLNLGIGERVPVSIATKRVVWARANARCEHQTDQGHRCASKHSLEFDHVIPLARGGSDGPDNLRLLCRAHHRLVTVDSFGLRKMQQFRPALW